jgi:hypothetical protein
MGLDFVVIRDLRGFIDDFDHDLRLMNDDTRTIIPTLVLFIGSAYTILTSCLLLLKMKTHP